jgi:hypothetical protein
MMRETCVPEESSRIITKVIYVQCVNSIFGDLDKLNRIFEV